MSTRSVRFIVLLFPLLGCMSLGHLAFSTGVSLYTPYTKISVPPGESIDYSIDVINNTAGIQNAEFSVTGLPKGWVYDLKAGGFNIGQLSVLPKEKKSISLRIDVPLQVNKGTYRFNLVAKGLGILPLYITVSEQGSLQTEFTSKQTNMEGHAGSTFNFTTELKNRTGEKQQYALRAETPRGWTVVFKPNYQQATSVSADVNATENIPIEVRPPAGISAGTYKIPVYAANNSTSASLELEVVVTGSYGLELTTPRGLLSTNLTAGEKKKIDLVVKNTGSAGLENIELKSSTPVNWTVEFEPKKLDKLEPGGVAEVTATIVADKKAIPGDYVTNMEAKTPEATSNASFRITVETSMLYGWTGIFVILASLGVVYQLFRRYGRR